ncbi:MAG: biotin--[acetyl-CoA-carboxylase] ligase [Bacteroidia bacterium]|nr:biotin--[acetyl-CoA-carboxylase] ligase [Bacteroidia bacterium]
MALKFIRHFFSELPSTQLLLQEWAAASSLPEGTLIWTGHQTSGYGRNGTPWYASPGESLTFSFIIYPSLAPGNLTAQTALALYDTLFPFAQDTLFIKWPNDLWCTQGKVAGILIEVRWKGNHPTMALIGIGINVYQTSFPAHLKAASLAQLGSAPPSLEKLLDSFEKAFSNWYTAPEEQIRTHFLQRLRREGLFLIAQREVEGTITDWSPTGWIEVTTPSEVLRLPASDLRIAWPRTSSS